MRLSGLEPLYRSMARQNIERYRFRYRHGRAVFAVFFFADTRPFELLFGCLGTNFAFTVDVHPGFIIHPYLGENYGRLCEVLGLTPNPDNPFSPAAFFTEFDRHIPGVAERAGVPRPEEVVVYRRDVDEAHKVFFCGWRDNTVRGEHVTETNLDKTLKLLGRRARDFCARHNTSSCWTDDRARAVEVDIPL